ncbi:Trk-type K+ transport system, membrane component [Candidatus Hepatincolaceae symbiont of Richtersius coronifer]
MNVNFRLVVSLLGYLIASSGGAMIVPAIIDYITNQKGFETFFFLSLIVTFIGFSLAFANKNEYKVPLSLKEGFLLTVLSWIVLAAVCALPFKFSYLNLSYTDAYFEVMSGLTTTGATTLEDLSQLSYGLNFWRIFMGWIGGIGIIVTGMVLIPSMQPGMQIFKVESFDSFDSAFDKAKRMAIGIIVVYILISLLTLFTLLFISNFNFFDALVHAFSAVSTTGFSNKNSSLLEFNSISAEIIISLAMFSGGLPYILLYYLIFLRKGTIFKDHQVRGYIKLVLIIIILLIAWLYLNNGIDFSQASRYGIFTAISLITGTGLTTADYSLWGGFSSVLLVIAMTIGSCSGSKSAGLKIYRIQVAYAICAFMLRKIFLQKTPNVILYNKRVVSYDIAVSIFTYCSLYFICLAFSSVILTALNLDLSTAISASIATLSNTGPGIGPLVGPSGNYFMIPDLGKWTLISLMLLGRLEILVVLVIFTRRFWKN